MDYVEKLGYLVEIEVKESTKSVMEEYDLLLNIAKELGLNLNHIDRCSYPYYLIKSKKFHQIIIFKYYNNYISLI